MMAGDMKLCLDNTFSHFSNKLVFFEIISDEDDDSDEKEEFGAGAQEELQQIMDMTLDDFKVIFILHGFIQLMPVFIISGKN